jgi:hypothetical protein
MRQQTYFRTSIVRVRDMGFSGWRFVCVVPLRDETQTASDGKPIRFRLANDWISQAC